MRDRLPEPVRFIAITLVSLLALYGLTRALLHIPCAWVFAVVVPASWPLWRYQLDRILFERRAILDSTSTASSFLRKLLWRGSIAAIVQVVLAVSFAIILLVMLAQLQPIQWAVLAVDAVFVALLLKPIRVSLASQIKSDYIATVSRLWPMTIINVLVLTAAFVALDFWYLGGPGNTDLTWAELGNSAFDSAAARASCPAVGVVMGFLGAIDSLTWQAAILLISDLPTVELKVTAWFAFLAWTGFGALLFTRFLLGVIATAESGPNGASSSTGNRRLAAIFVLTVAGLITILSYSANLISQIDLGVLANRGKQVLAGANPCRVAPIDVSDLRKGVDVELQRGQQAAYQEAELRIDGMLNPIFLEAEAGVDRYLDWYFSMVGNYTLLGSAIVGESGERVQAKLSELVLDESALLATLENESQGLEIYLAAHMDGVAKKAAARISGDAVRTPCRKEALNLDALLGLERDQLRLAVSTASGLGVGVATARFLSKLSARTAAKRVAGRASAKALTNVAAKGVTRRGASILGAGLAAGAACSVGGPITIAICAAGAAVVTTLIVDKGMIEAEEALFREQMRAELLQELQDQRGNIKNELIALHRSLIDQYASAIRSQVAATFIPAEHVL